MIDAGASLRAPTWATIVRRFARGLVPFALLSWLAMSGCAPVTPASALERGEWRPGPGQRDLSSYPWHTDIAVTTFWVGEIADPHAADGSQEVSSYDSAWLAHYGGCDGVVRAGICSTEVRTVVNGYFPTRMTPLENPFYLDLPYDDIGDPDAFARRDDVVPWAAAAPYAEHRGDAAFSYLKNRWVHLRFGERECFGQVQDAGPGEYNDAEYVFGRGDVRPINTRWGGAGMDVSPALTSCLGFSVLDGVTPGVDWRFIAEGDVPPGPWRSIVTRSQVR